MARKIDSRDIKEWFRFIPTRYVVRLLPIVIVIAAVGWFFLLRSPDGQTNTSGATGTAGATPETTTTNTTHGAQPEAKVTDNSTVAAKPTGDSKGKDSNLPETGPADTLAIAGVATTAGTLFWEWRLRRAQMNTN